METVITALVLIALLVAAFWILKWILSLGRISGLLFVIAILLVVIIFKLSALGG